MPAPYTTLYAADIIAAKDQLQTGYYWPEFNKWTTTNTIRTLQLEQTWDNWTLEIDTASTTALTYKVQTWTQWASGTNSATVYVDNTPVGTVDYNGLQNELWKAFQPHQPTQAELQQRERERKRLEREAVQRQRRWEAEQRRRERERSADETRARRLLLSVLSPEQRDEFERLERFHVITPDGHKYRVKRSWTNNLELIEVIDGQEMITEQLCVHPRQQVPPEDSMVAQKLLLETSPEEIRKVAVISRLRRVA